MRMQQRLAALLWSVPGSVALALGGCATPSTTMPEPSYPPPGGYAQGPGGGYPSSQETVAVETAPTVHYAETYPPEPLYETMAPSPSEDHVWVDGYWHWNGYEWVWIGGNWVPEQVGYVYIEPYYDYDDGYYVYQPGHWRRHAHVPRGVIVRDHRQGRPITGHYPRSHQPHRPDYRVPIERGKHPPRPPHASPGHESPGVSPGAPIVRDHRRDTMPGRGAPPPRSAPLPRHRGPDQAEPPTVPRRPPPDISSPPPRAIPSGRPTPRIGAPAPRTGPGIGDVPPRTAPPRPDAPPPRSVPGPRITPRHTPPVPRGGAGGAPPRGLPPPRSVPGREAPPPRSAPPARDRSLPGAPPPRSAPSPRVTPHHTSPPQGGQRPAPMGAPLRRRN